MNLDFALLIVRVIAGLLVFGCVVGTIYVSRHGDTETESGKGAIDGLRVFGMVFMVLFLISFGRPDVWVPIAFGGGLFYHMIAVPLLQWLFKPKLCQ